jgi:hypothetical protein
MLTKQLRSQLWSKYERKKLFTWQKKTDRITVGINSHNSCRDLFKRIEILTLPYEDIFSLTNFITNNEEHFQTNADVHVVNTRHKYYLHKTTASLSRFHKNAYYATIKIFTNLQTDLKSLMNEKAPFKIALKRYLNTHSCYSIEEYLFIKNESSI